MKIKNGLDIAEMLPRGYRGYISEEVRKEVMEINEESGIGIDLFRDNIELFDWYCKGDMTKYIGAIRYCSLRLMGVSQEKSYRRTFPERVKGLEEKWGSESKKHIKGCADAYNGSKLISEIMSRALVPSWIVNAPYFQEAVMKLVEIIRDDSVKNGMAKVRACEALIAATKRPEVIEQKISIEGDGSNKMMDELREITEELAKKMRNEMVGKKGGLKEIAEVELVKGEDGSYE